MKNFGYGSRDHDAFMRIEYELAADQIRHLGSRGKIDDNNNNNNSNIVDLRPILQVTHLSLLTDRIHDPPFEFTARRVLMKSASESHFSLIQRSSANVVASMVFGHRLGEADAKANHVFDNLCAFFSINPQVR